MTKRKLRDLTAVFFCGLFVLTFEPVFLWLLVGAMVLFQSDSSHSEKKNTTSNILFEIGRDARKYGMTMPKRLSTRSLLIKVYQNYRRSLKNYPHLKEEYAEVIEEMWLSLSSEEESDMREKIILGVLSDWPESGRAGHASIKTKLEKVRELTAQWDEAKHEVQGGAGV